MANVRKSVVSPYQVSEEVTWDDEVIKKKKVLRFHKKWFLVLAVLILVGLIYCFFPNEKQAPQLERFAFEIPKEVKKIKIKFDLCSELTKIHRNTNTNVSETFLKKCQRNN